MVNDTVASGGYLLAFIVCATWVGIAVGNVMTRHRMLRWTALAITMLAAAVSFLLMSMYTGWKAMPYSNTLSMTRVGFTVMSVVGSVFTVMYLWSIYRRSPRAGGKDDRNAQELD